MHVRSTDDKNKARFSEDAAGNVELECTYEENAKSGCMHMTLPGAEISQDGMHLGDIRPIVGGGGTEVIIGGFTYRLTVQNLWAAAYAAHEAWKKNNEK